MIRVLHVVNGFHAGGVETQLLRILRGYDRSRFSMDACVIGDDPGSLAEEARGQGATILSCKKSPDLMGFCRRFSKLIQGKNYDVVHSHFEAWSGPLLRGARTAGVPVRIAQLHGIRPWPAEASDPISLRAARAVVSMWGRYWLCRNATQLLAVSKAIMEKRQLLCRGSNLVPLIWTGGVDTDKFSPATTVSPKARPQSTILWVGALRPIKRIDLHLHVLKLVHREVPEARLVLAGQGNQESLLRELAQQLRVADAVDFLGLREDIPELLRSATIFLSCSEAEGLPTVLLEAQAVGVPVVARDIGPNREALCEAFHPFLFRGNNVEEAAGHVVRMLTDPLLRDTLSKMGRDFVVKDFCASTQLRKLENYYESWRDAAKELQ